MPVSNPQPTVSPYVEGTAYNGLVRVSFRIQADGTSAPNFVIPAGACSAPDQTGTGLYTVTLANFTKYAGLVAGSISILKPVTSTSEAVFAHILSYTASTGVLLFDTYALGTTPALADVLADDWIMFDLVMALNAAEVVATAVT